MKEFSAHPFWPFLGTIVAIVSFLIRPEKLKLGIKDANLITRQIVGWIVAILSIVAFVIGNMIGQSGILSVFGELDLESINILTGIITFFVTMILISIGIRVKTLIFRKLKM